MKKFNQTIAFFMAFAMLLTISPIESSAKWREMDSNLPGFSEGPSTGVKVALGVVGFAAVGALVYIIVKKKKDKQTVSTYSIKQTIPYNMSCRDLNGSVLGNGNLNIAPTENNNSISFGADMSLAERMQAESQSVPVDFIVKPINSGNNMAFNANGVELGIRIRF